MTPKEPWNLRKDAEKVLDEYLTTNLKGGEFVNIISNFGRRCQEETRKATTEFLRKHLCPDCIEKLKTVPVRICKFCGEVEED